MSSNWFSGVKSSGGKFASWAKHGDVLADGVRFTGPAEVEELHWAAGKSYECGDNCERCERGQQSTTKYRLPIVTRDGDAMQFSISPKAASDLKRLATELGDEFPKTYIACTRSGSGFNTRYSFAVLETDGDGDGEGPGRDRIPF
jgi:hypothetical protein